MAKTTALINVAAFAAMFYFLVHAMSLGNAWDSQANPQKGAQIALKDGSTFTGSLSRTWNDTWKVETDDGVIHEFAEFNWISVSTQNQPEFSIWIHWRAFLPVIVLASVYIAFICWSPKKKRPSIVH